jgi:DHA1 family multidrug resistance protein-like MFS transporter
VHSSAFLVGAIMAPLWGSIADKYGKRKMVIRAGLSLAVIYSLLAFVRNPWELIVVRMLHGFVGGFVPASMAIVASVVPKDKLGSSLGMMQAGTMTGGILGPLFGGLLAVWFGQRNSFIVAGCIIFVATLGVIFWVREGKMAAPSKSTGMLQGLREAFHSRSLVNMLLLLVVFQLSVNMIQPLLTLHIADLQGSLDNAVLSSGIIFSLIGIAGIIASPIWGRLGERRGYNGLLSFCLICAGIIVSMQFFVHSLWLFTIVQFAFGLFLAGVVPTVNTLMVRSTDESFRGRSFGLTTSANQIGAMIGPLLGGAMGYFLNISWIFVTTGLLLLCAGLTMLIRIRSISEESI